MIDAFRACCGPANAFLRLFAPSGGMHLPACAAANCQAATNSPYGFGRWGRTVSLPSSLSRPRVSLGARRTKLVEEFEFLAKLSSCGLAPQELAIFFDGAGDLGGRFVDEFDAEFSDAKLDHSPGILGAGLG